MPTRRILLIDDEAPVLMVLKSCFEDLAGWEVSIAASGEEGLRKVLTEKPYASVLDIMMPEMDGIELLRHLKAEPKTQSIPVVVLSAKVEALQDHYFWNCKIVGAIAKPFDPLKLVERVAEFLGWELIVG